MIYFCCNEERREKMSKQGALYGIDYLEVEDGSAPGEFQRRLVVHLFQPVVDPGLLKKENIRIIGGERIRNIRAVKDPVFAELKQSFTVEVDQAGDFSVYTLRIENPESHEHLTEFDPVFSEIDFSFKVGCPSDFDCLDKPVCPPQPPVEPEIDYLVRDYASFRRLMLDRMALTMPRWKERNAADMGVALVELLAYAGDHLSYQQDAIATEAYLGTARRRVSIRRHARLVDYFMHDGCNARVWVHVKVSEIVGFSVDLPEGTRFLTSVAGQPACIQAGADGYKQAMLQQPITFESMHSVTLHKEHNKLYFYTWNSKNCCLPKGAVRATLRGHNFLKKGDVLIFVEAKGPQSGKEHDADPARRHAVSLTAVLPASDPLYADQDGEVKITEIRWSDEDALPFPFCISSVTDAEHGDNPVEDVSVALGNIVLADNGMRIEKEDLGTVPAPKSYMPSAATADYCKNEKAVQIPLRFRPRLKEKPLTQAAPYEPEASAHRLFRWRMREVKPWIRLNGGDWTPKRDLLGSGAFDKDFVVEVEEDGGAFLRFGDDRRGLRPNKGTEFNAVYRVGNGSAGNIGAEALSHAVTDLPAAIEAVGNPMPAFGGTDPETIEEVRQRAPFAFRIQERAVTEEDYAGVTERNQEVAQACATFRWTGSWHTVFLTVDRPGSLVVDDDFEGEIRRQVERFRMAGHDLEVDRPRYVPLEVEMTVCVKSDYFRSDVKAALLEILSSRNLPDGRRGLLHPDNFGFGQTVYLSPIYAAAQAVPGVASVNITKFQRWGAPDAMPREEGKIILGRLEIARIDNDPNFPEHGVLRLSLGGGK